MIRPTVVLRGPGDVAVALTIDGDIGLRLAGRSGVVVDPAVGAPGAARRPEGEVDVVVAVARVLPDGVGVAGAVDSQGGMALVDEGRVVVHALGRAPGAGG